MRGNRGPGIDDPTPDDVAVRPVQRQRRRVRRAHADDPIRNRHGAVSTGVVSPRLGSRMNTGGAAWERRAFPLALVAIAVVVVLDLSVDTFALLIQLLLVGPLIAATGATVRQTIIVAAVAVAVSVTLRTAAMRERLPSRSLSLLNEALLRQRDDRRFCTVAYA